MPPAVSSPSNERRPSYNLHDDLFLCTYLVNLTEDPLAFTKVSKQLLDNPLIRSADDFTESKFAPEALQQRLSEIFREEGKLGQDGTLGADGGKKRKLSADGAPAVATPAPIDKDIVSELAHNFMERLKEQAVQGIREDERQMNTVTKEIKLLEIKSSEENLSQPALETSEAPAPAPAAPLTTIDLRKDEEEEPQKDARAAERLVSPERVARPDMITTIHQKVQESPEKAPRVSATQTTAEVQQPGPKSPPRVQNEAAPAQQQQGPPPQEAPVAKSKSPPKRSSLSLLLSEENLTPKPSADVTFDPPRQSPEPRATQQLQQSQPQPPPPSATHQPAYPVQVSPTQPITSEHVPPMSGGPAVPPPATPVAHPLHQISAPSQLQHPETAQPQIPPPSGRPLSGYGQIPPAMGTFSGPPNRSPISATQMSPGYPRSYEGQQQQSYGGQTSPIGGPLAQGQDSRMNDAVVPQHHPQQQSPYAQPRHLPQNHQHPPSHPIQQSSPPQHHGLASSPYRAPPPPSLPLQQPSRTMPPPAVSPSATPLYSGGQISPGYRGPQLSPIHMQTSPQHLPPPPQGSLPPQGRFPPPSTPQQQPPPQRYPSQASPNGMDYSPQMSHTSPGPTYQPHNGGYSGAPYSSAGSPPATYPPAHSPPLPPQGQFGGPLPQMSPRSGYYPQGHPYPQNHPHPANPPYQPHPPSPSQYPQQGSPVHQPTYHPPPPIPPPPAQPQPQPQQQSPTLHQQHGPPQQQHAMSPPQGLPLPSQSPSSATFRNKLPPIVTAQPQPGSPRRPGPEEISPISSPETEAWPNPNQLQQVKTPAKTRGSSGTGRGRGTGKKAAAAAQGEDSGSTRGAKTPRARGPRGPRATTSTRGAGRGSGGVRGRGGRAGSPTSPHSHDDDTRSEAGTSHSLVTPKKRGRPRKDPNATPVSQGRRGSLEMKVEQHKSPGIEDSGTTPDDVQSTVTYESKTEDDNQTMVDADADETPRPNNRDGSIQPKREELTPVEPVTPRFPGPISTKLDLSIGSGAVSPAIPNKAFHKLAMPLLNNISSHKFANLFTNPVEKQIPGYSNYVFKPQDLKSIRAAVKASTTQQLPSTTTPTPTTETGPNFRHSATPSTPIASTGPSLISSKQVISSSGQLEKEILRMFANAVMFNKSTSPIADDTRVMTKDVEKLLDTVLSAEKASRKKAQDAAQSMESGTAGGSRSGSAIGSAPSGRKGKKRRVNDTADKDGDVEMEDQPADKEETPVTGARAEESSTEKDEEEDEEDEEEQEGEDADEDDDEDDDEEEDGDDDDASMADGTVTTAAEEDENMTEADEEAVADEAHAADEAAAAKPAETKPKKTRAARSGSTRTRANTRTQDTPPPPADDTPKAKKPKEKKPKEKKEKKEKKKETEKNGEEATTKDKKKSKTTKEKKEKKEKETNAPRQKRKKPA